MSNKLRWIVIIILLSLLAIEINQSLRLQEKTSLFFMDDNKKICSILDETKCYNIDDYTVIKNTLIDFVDNSIIAGYIVLVNDTDNKIVITEDTYKYLKTHKSELVDTDKNELKIMLYYSAMIGTLFLILLCSLIFINCCKIKRK